ncbi:hypothetical protein [Roseovarius sp. MMSF_3350]|uniref:hypothetical protein n=1 Tax=Roseovarius sp. MMSF_3350 TaxID=3046706 RepID=UPI00273D5C14|nr:hypothetical protein [Roseovarius sp. MMSF_3350]
MAAEKYQANLPFVGQDGKTTMISQQFLEKLVSEVIALRAEVNDHEDRITTLEP